MPRAKLLRALLSTGVAFMYAQAWQETRLEIVGENVFDPNVNVAGALFLTPVVNTVANSMHHFTFENKNFSKVGLI